MPRRALIICVLLLLSTGARGRDLAFTSPKDDVPVRMKGLHELRSLTPFTISAADAYSRIEVGGRGYEYHRADISWSRHSEPRLTSRRFRNTVLGMALPGMGSYLSGRRLHGVAELGGLTWLVTNAWLTGRDYDDLGESQEELRSRYLIETDAAARARLELYMEMTAARRDEVKTHFELQSTLCGAYAAVLAFEGWWFNSPLRASHKTGELFLRAPRLSRGKAVFASLLCPGMGQAYRGQRRASLYTVVEAFLLQELLDSYLDQRKHVSDRDLLALHINTHGATTANLAEMDRYNDLVDQDDRDVNLFAGLAAGIYLVNVIDALISHPEELPSSRDTGLTMMVSPGGRPGLAWTRSF